MLATVAEADALGLDLVGVQDHPYQPAFLDTWTLLSVLAARTTRIRLFPDVANLPLRPPAVLARSAASLDALSGGRVELGLGAGYFWDAVAGEGGPRRSPGESVDALAEAIAVIRALWARGGRADVDGRYYRLAGARPGPAAAHPIAIWVGAYQPRMLRLVGRLADGWVPSLGYLDPPGLGAAGAAVDAAARRAGRDPAEIRRVYNVTGAFGVRDGFLRGTPGDWAADLAGLVREHGFSGFVLGVEPGDTGTLRTWAREVAPRLRAAVDAARAGAPPASPASSPPAHAAAAGAGARLLLQIHDHLRGELAQLREALAAVEAGVADPAAVRGHLQRLDVRRVCWSVGAFCATHCRTVAVHHAIEDGRLFPDLGDADPALAPVVARLAAEHREVAEALERIDDALAALAGAPPDAAPVRAAVEGFAGLLLGHLQREEAALLDPIDRLGIEV